MRKRFHLLLTVLVTALTVGATVALARTSGGAPASARTVKLQVLGHADPGGGYSADVFGHRGYAYLGSWHGAECPAQGVRVYDVRNPRRPVRVASFADRASDPSVAGTWTEKVIVRRVAGAHFRGDLAVASFQACRDGAFQGFGLYDVTDPAKPRRLALFRTEPRGSHELWLGTRGGRVYVYTAIPWSELYSAPDYNRRSRTAQTPGLPGFRIVDVSDPTTPVQVGAWGAWTELGINPRQGRGRVLNANIVHSVITDPAGTRAYISYWDLGTVILDITDPTRPRYLGRTSHLAGEEGDAHSAALGAGGKLLVETHEVRQGSPTLYDLSDPRAPRRLSNFRLPRGAIGGTQGGRGLDSLTDSVHDPKVVGTRAYFSWFGQGVVVADIADPARPRCRGQFVPPAAESPDGRLCGDRPCAMVWGVSPQPDFVLASDMLSGLWVLRAQ